ncbi:MAG: potassium channel protein [Rickettsiales bacterium]|nr:potassium channel protein [Rickettsiales bacterium]RPG13143.1 MAG: ion transporter [Pelagibacteraceae bacterium TMED195]|tara:strand:+ start:1576 stop:2499 length:924 start_codon:yes stop_codon:yes gene_type:complete
MIIFKKLNLNRKRVWKLLEPAEDNDNLSKFIDIFLVNLIFFNILMVILETVDTLYFRYRLWFIYFELFSVTIFSIEYVSRFWSCVENKTKGETNGKARLRYIFSFSAIIDLIAILPSLLAFLFPTVDLRFVRALRIFRLLKFSRYSNSINTLLIVLWDQRKSLGAAFFILFIVLIISSSGMYIVEKDIQPDKFGSIPQSMWWSIVTLTTVGYGDVYPVTSMGKFFGSIIIILGIGTVALPSGILASAFTEYTRRNQKKYEDKLKFMLSDNIIDDEERKELDELSEKLNLSDEDIEAIEDHFKNKKKS